MIKSSIYFTYKGNDHLKSFVDKHIYEPFTINLLKQIPAYRNLQIIQDQSNGQDDFLDIQTKCSIDVTILLNNGILSKVFNNRNCLYINDSIKQRKQDTMSVFIDSLERKKNKKTHIVLLNLFPDLFPKYQDSLTEITLKDTIDHAIEEIYLTKKDLLLDKKISMVSFNHDNSFYFRTLFKRENNLCFISDYDHEIYPFHVVNSALAFL